MGIAPSTFEVVEIKQILRIDLYCSPMTLAWLSIPTLTASCGQNFWITALAVLALANLVSLSQTPRQPSNHEFERFY